MRVVCLLAAVAVANLLAGPTARADVLADVRMSGELKVGTQTSFPPFDYIDEGEHVGLNVDLFGEVGRELGVKVTWVALPWEGVLPGLAAKRFDMVAGPATITKARMEHYAFSSPVGVADADLVKRRGDTSISRPEDIAGKVVGGGKASSQLDQLMAYCAKLPNPPIVRQYVGTNEGLADLAAGRISAWVSSYPNNAAAVRQRPDTFELVSPPFGVRVYFGYVGRKDADSASLMEAVDGAIARMKADGRMDALQRKWLGAVPELPASVRTPAL